MPRPPARPAVAEDAARSRGPPELRHGWPAAPASADTRTISGQPARSILDQAAAWNADVIVLGRSGVRHVGQPFVGSHLLHVLEFAEVPVVVVPA